MAKKQLSKQKYTFLDVVCSKDTVVLGRSSAVVCSSTLKQNCLSTLAPSFIGCAPFNHPGCSPLHRNLEGPTFSLSREPASPITLYQPDAFTALVLSLQDLTTSHIHHLTNHLQQTILMQIVNILFLLRMKLMGYTMIYRGLKMPGSAKPNYASFQIGKQNI